MVQAAVADKFQSSRLRAPASRDAVTVPGGGMSAGRALVPGGTSDGAGGWKRRDGLRPSSSTWVEAA